MCLGIKSNLFKDESGLDGFFGVWMGVEFVPNKMKWAV